MACVLKLSDYGVRQALRHEALAGLPRIGRGWFASVYDRGDTVLKVTCDPKQYALSAECLAPLGPYFPVLVKDFGDIGETTRGGLPIYMMEMEKLQPIGRDAPIEVKRLARRLTKEVRSMVNFHSYRSATCARNSDADSARFAMQDLADSEKFEPVLSEALRDIGNFIGNYGDTFMDLHGANLMRRGEQLVLNDVVADQKLVEGANTKPPQWLQ